MFGDVRNPSSLNAFGYGNGNPLVFTDPRGESGTVVGAVGGFFWGFGQMAIGMGKDVYRGRAGSFTKYMGVWGQNIVAGAEMGAAFDVGVLSGGLAASGSGALGMAGWDALTLNGEGKSAGEFFKGQAVEGAKGAVLGPVVAKVAAPIVKAVTKIPGVEAVARKAAQVAGSVAKKVGEKVVTETDRQAMAAADRALGSAVNQVSGLSRRVFGQGGAGTEEGFLFRGTTEGYPGNPSTQRIGITPASTDPAVATVFATEASAYGEGVVQVIPRAGLPTVEPNVLGAMEAEVGVEMLPAELAAKARSVPVARARAILKSQGIEIPARVTDISAVLKETAKMSPEQVAEFIRRALAAE